MLTSISPVPPIIGACFVRDLGRITDYTGITGFALAFIFPGLLQRASKERMSREIGGAGAGAGAGKDTIYGMGWGLSGPRVAGGVTAFGVLLVVFVLGSLMLD